MLKIKNGITTKTELVNKISVIVPVYNVEKYLAECLESIVNQTYKNLEIILVNDGSTDSCAQVCNEYALKDHRIKVINQKNGGLSAARNTGLQIVTGDFISFIDSDDLIAADFYQKLLQISIENKADIVECDFSKFETPAEIERTVMPFRESFELFKTEKALELLMREYLKQVVWNKIYRKEIIQDFQFPVGKINEDEYWTYKVLGNSKKIAKIPDVLYFYRQQGSSIMGREYSVKRLDGLNALEERIKYMKINYPNLENLAIKIFSFGSIWHYQQINKKPQIDPKGIFRKKILNSVKKYNNSPMFKRWKATEVFWYQFFIIAPNFCVKFRNFIRVGI